MAKTSRAHYTLKFKQEAIKPDIMGKFMIPAKLKILGWLATAMMALTVVAMFLSM